MPGSGTVATLDEARERVAVAIYLGPNVPRWAPSSEADLATALEQGLIGETHYLEVKLLVEPGKGANTELARDLASLAVDGGTLIVGLDEDRESATFSLAPQSLAGQPERVEQVARSIPDPPLEVIVEVIRSASDDLLGYLIVNVPASPMAPHMVQGRYMGRGETTKMTLSDSEVSRLHDRRRDLDRDISAVLSAEIARDPMATDAQAHLFLVAEPVTPRQDMLAELIDGSDWIAQLHAIIQTISARPPQESFGGFSPGWSELSRYRRRSAGASVSNYVLGADRGIDPEAGGDRAAVDLEFLYDGGIRIYMSRLSDELRPDRAGGRIRRCRRALCATPD